MEKTIIVLRGLPGSGKTTLAETIHSLNKNISAIISLDTYRSETGVYVYKIEDIPILVARMMTDLRTHIKDGTKLIIVDNTHSRLEEFSETERIGKENGYKVHVINIEYENIEDLIERRNTDHKSISQAVFTHMINRWQFKSNPKPIGWYLYRIKKYIKRCKKWLLEN